EILVDIGVIELDRCEDYSVREVMQELWTLVEECRIVLIAFKDEVLALSQSKAGAEVFCNPSDQKRGVLPSHLKNPGEHGCCRGFPMRTGYNDRLATAEKIFVKDVRQ